MANWQYKLNLSDIWHKDLPIPKLAKETARRIKKLPCYKTEFYLKRLVKRFEQCPDDVDRFDRIYGNLCDWGDSETAERSGVMANRLCWINTF